MIQNSDAATLTRTLSADAVSAIDAFLDLYVPLVRPKAKLDAIVAVDLFDACQEPLQAMIRSLVDWREGPAE